MGDWPTYVGVATGAAGTITGAIALCIAARANQAAKDGNTLAETANNIAANALGEAQKTNSIAENANQLAGDANLIAKRALQVAQDDIPYNWVLEINDDGSAIVLNDCRHHAAQVTVVIDAGSEPVARCGPVDVAAFEKLPFNVASAVEKHFENVRQHPYRPTQAGTGWMSVGGPGDPVACIFRAHLSWLTDDEVPRNDVVEKVVSHQMDYAGIVRLTD